jgi:hypothetical protein
LQDHIVGSRLGIGALSRLCSILNRPAKSRTAIFVASTRSGGPSTSPTRLWATQPELGRTGVIRERFASTPKPEPGKREESKHSPRLENQPGANPRIPVFGLLRRSQRRQLPNPLCSSGLRCSREGRPPRLAPQAQPSLVRAGGLGRPPPWIILLGLCKSSSTGVDGCCWLSVWHG